MLNQQRVWLGGIFLRNPPRAKFSADQPITTQSDPGSHPVRNRRRGLWSPTGTANRKWTTRVPVVPARGPKNAVQGIGRFYRYVVYQTKIRDFPGATAQQPRFILRPRFDHHEVIILNGSYRPDLKSSWNRDRYRKMGDSTRFLPSRTREKSFDWLEGERVC